MTFEELTARRDQLLADVDAWSMSQVALWQQIPYLALRACLYQGFGDGRRMHAYKNGHWQLGFNSGMVRIDCAIGSIWEHTRVMQHCHLNELDPCLAIASLEALCVGDLSDPRNQRWFNEACKDYDLGPDNPYHRLAGVRA